MDPHERLSTARERAGYASATDAARAFGWNENTYRSHENGERGLRPDPAARYAKAFRVSSAWLLTGEGGSIETRTVGVMGSVGAGGRIDTSSEQLSAAEPLFEIEVDIPVPGDALAFRVDGESMWPRYDPGDVVICYRHAENPAKLLGFEAVVETGDGARYLKRLLRGGESETFTLESHNAGPIRDVRIAWASEVRHVVRAARWRQLDNRGVRREMRKASV